MPIFSLGECSVDLAIEPLLGAHAQIERQIAWQLYLEIVTRPGLRSDTFSSAEITELIATLRRLLATWPAPQIEEGRPKQLGAVLLALINMVLLPCQQSGHPSASAWLSVRTFCQALASSPLKKRGGPSRRRRAPPQGERNALSRNGTRSC